MKFNSAIFFTIITYVILISPIKSIAEDNLKLYGTLIVPPNCTINNEEIIEVDFGNNLGVNKIDGVNYSQQVDYNLQCNPNLHGWELKLKILGNQSDFNAAALQTNLTDLAIYLKLDGQAFTLDQWFPISAEAPPELTAVPIKRPGTTLPAEPFEATATLLAEYQ